MNNSNMSINQEDPTTADGELPVDLDTFFIVSKLISCSVGIPLNLTVIIIIAITRNRQLCSQPRNIFLLGITFSYLSFFVPAAIIELIDWKLSSIESVCQSNVAVIIGPPHALLLLNMSLALIDRYLAINHPVWYREKMTVSLASALVILGWLIKFLYILGLGAPTCQMWNVHTRTLAVVLVVLFSICTALNLIVHRQTPKIRSQTLNRRYLDDRMLATAAGEDIEWVAFDVFGNLTFNQTTSSAIIDDRSPGIRLSPMIHSDPNRDDLMSEAEIKATRTLIVGVTSFVITACGSVLFIASFFACRIILSELQCGNLAWMGRYVRELSLIPAFYGSLIFLVGNDELMKTCCPMK